MAIYFSPFFFDHPVGMSIGSTVIENWGMSIRSTVIEKLGMSARSTVIENWGMSVRSNPKFGCAF